MNVVELGKKLIALIEKGEGGEKETAKLKFEQLCQKHNLSENDFFNDTEAHYYEHKFENPHDDYERKLFTQVVYAITGSNKNIYEQGNRKDILLCRCTEAQNIEITIAQDYYFELFKRERDLFYIAFVHKHDLFGVPEKGKENKPELSPEDERELYFMKSVMKNGNPNKRLCDNNTEV